MKSNRLLASVALSAMLVSSNPSHAIFGVGDIVLDPANLAQNVLQVVEAIEEGLRTLEQIELAARSIDTTDLSLKDDLIDRLKNVQAALNKGDGIIFDKVRSLEKYREKFPDTFEALDKIEEVSAILRGQNQEVIDAAERAIQTQSTVAETIEDVQKKIDEALGVSESATGQTQAIQAGNQLQGLVISMLGEMQAAELAAQRLEALKAANEASKLKAAIEANKRFSDGSKFKGARFDGVLPDGWVE